MAEVPSSKLKHITKILGRNDYCVRDITKWTRVFICESPKKNTLILIIIIIIIITAVELSLGGRSPYTSTDKTNNNKYT
jgi:hypothetical protein